MSALQTSGYRVLDQNVFGRSYGGSVIDQFGTLVDSFRSLSAAEYAARMLNNDLATVNPHAVVGCRVEVK